jgi:hypothetical protein
MYNNSAVRYTLARGLHTTQGREKPEEYNNNNNNKSFLHGRVPSHAYTNSIRHGSNQPMDGYIKHYLITPSFPRGFLPTIYNRHIMSARVKTTQYVPLVMLNFLKAHS